MNDHREFIDALRSNIEDNTAFLTYADFVQDRHGEDEAERIREVVNQTTEAIRGSDETEKGTGKEQPRSSDPVGVRSA